MGSRFSAAPRDPASVRGRPFARGNSPGPSHIRGGGTRRKKDLPFIGETVLLERKPPRGESKAHDVGPLPGLTPGPHRKGSSKKQQNPTPDPPPPPRKNPQKDPKGSPEVKESGAKMGTGARFSKPPGTAICPRKLPGPVTTIRHGRRPGGNWDLPFVGATVLLERKPPRGESKAQDVGPLPGLTPGSVPQGQLPESNKNPGKNPPPPPTRENPKGQGATLQTVRDETRNESRIVVEGIQGSLSFSRQSLVWGRGVWKCRALGPDAALSRRPGARSSSGSLSYANLFLFFSFHFHFNIIFPF